MSIETLQRIVAPPETPLEVPSVPHWNEVERAIGAGLPRDFRACVERYGTGSFDRFLWVLNPFSSNPHLRLFDRIERNLDALRMLKKDDPGEIPYALFPEQEGLLPWGITDNGDGLYWHTAGDPDQWSVVVNAARDPECEEFPLGMTDFLAQILSRRARSEIFPSDFPRPHPSFHPLAQT